jgi:hypothetical protein
LSLWSNTNLFNKNTKTKNKTLKLWKKENKIINIRLTKKLSHNKKTPSIIGKKGEKLPKKFTK